MITRAITNAFRIAEEKNWDCTYWAFDIHGTIIVPNFSAAEIPTEFYPGAKEALLAVTARKDIVTILYTCSHQPEIAQYLEYFKGHGIQFDYVNSNPEVENGAYGNYDFKPYFNVLFEDKSGFDPIEDWPLVNELLTTG